LPNILILYDFFEPAYKAGGPSVSCANLARLMQADFNVSVFTRAVDIDGTVLDVPQDQWTNLSSGIRVYYAATQWNLRGLLAAIQQTDPDIIYLNGVFSWVCTLLPLLLLKLRIAKASMILAPRGMLQVSSLNIKRWKKKTYLPLLRMLLDTAVKLHVTSVQEESELPLALPSVAKKSTVLVHNVPNAGIMVRKNYVREGRLRLVTIALISPMKQILEVLQALNTCECEVIYHLYGPVHDEQYWKQCQDVVQRMRPGVEFQYFGPLVPGKVPEVLSGYDVYIQPSKSENFGHSLYEAMMVGLPVITSHGTPWQNLDQQNAGWNVESTSGIALAISAAADLMDDRYGAMSKAARLVVDHHNDAQNYLKDYTELFSL